MLNDSDAKQLISAKLREKLDECEWTQGDLARALRDDDKSLVSWRMRVSRWCSGETLPSAADLCNISEVLGCEIDDLLPISKKT